MDVSIWLNACNSKEMYLKFISKYPGTCKIVLKPNPCGMVLPQRKVWNHFFGA